MEARKIDSYKRVEKVWNWLALLGRVMLDCKVGEVGMTCEGYAQVFYDDESEEMIVYVNNDGAYSILHVNLGMPWYYEETERSLKFMYHDKYVEFIDLNR